MKCTLDAQAVKELIDRVGDHIDDRYDYTYSPTFPEGREDVCAVNRMVENGSTYGYNVVYLVWLDANGKVRYREIADTRATKDYIHIDKVAVENDVVQVSFRSGGSYSGTPWQKTEDQTLE